MAGSTASSTGSKSSVGGSKHPPNRRRSRVPTQCHSAPPEINEQVDEDEEANEVRPTRDSSRGLGVQKAIAKNGGKKLPVNLDYKGKTYKAIGDNDAAFHNHIGQVVRDLFPPYANTWKNIPEDLKVQVYPRLQQTFDFKDTVYARAMVNREAMTRFRDWKTDLYFAFENCGGLDNSEAAKEVKPKTVKTIEDWHKCVERFCSEEFQKMRARNKANRLNKKTTSYQGSKSFTSHRFNKEKMENERLQATQAASEAGSTRDICTIETEVVESVLKSGRGHKKAVGPILGKSVQMAADLS